MKLRNNKIGINGELHFEPDKEYPFTVVTEYHPADVMIYKKLADLYADWDDYEEPKEYWYLYSDGIAHATDSGKYPDSDFLREEIGNYFETCEEAELAAKKLKAYKRLKDVGFKFRGTDILDYTNCIKFSFASDTRYDHEEMLKDLDLLFGGEE